MTHVARDNNIFDNDQGIELILFESFNYQPHQRKFVNAAFPLCVNEICLTLSCIML